MKIFDAQNILYRLIESEAKTIRDIWEDAYSLSQYCVCMWVWEGYNSRDQRKKLYPQYKTKRSTTPENIKVARQLIKDLLLTTNVFQVSVPGYEGDDVINHIVQKYHRGEPLHIHSNDKDFLQLGGHPGVTMDSAPIEGVPPHKVRLYKTLVGDSSDNITGLKGFGPKKFQEVDTDTLNAIFRSPQQDMSLVHTILIRDGVRPAVAEPLLITPEIFKNMWTITGFFPIEEKVYQDNIIIGRPDYEKGNHMLKELFQ